MPCEQCGGGGWVIVRVGQQEGAAPCPVCRATLPIEPCTRLTLPLATGLIDTLCDALAFSPTTPTARGLITSLVMEMCETEEQLTYVVKRAATLHNRWDTCGVAGLRQILCGKYQPKDGYSVTATEAYPEGIPAEHPTPPLEPLRLPPAGQDAIRATFELLAQQVPRTSTARRRPPRATQADIDAIKEQQRLNQERRRKVEEALAEGSGSPANVGSSSDDNG